MIVRDTPRLIGLSDRLLVVAEDTMAAMRREFDLRQSVNSASNAAAEYAVVCD